VRLVLAHVREFSRNLVEMVNWKVWKVTQIRNGLNRRSAYAPQRAPPRVGNKKEQQLEHLTCPSQLAPCSWYTASAFAARHQKLPEGLLCLSEEVNRPLKRRVLCVQPCTSDQAEPRFVTWRVLVISYTPRFPIEGSRKKGERTENWKKLCLESSRPEEKGRRSNSAK